ncbi:CRTISO [Symbiodinium pilosum]|uniref:CRTISO protein n=1 Tax=Symbiodinium pilosum TaxID=2952 RepID=A0A812V1L4_SYMPI|nr:CRTISO [Symbiodinium pilosum]
MVTPDGDFEFKVGDEGHWEDVVARFGTANAIKEWRDLMAIAKPLGEISKSIPAAALRGDLGAVQTLQRFFSRLPALLLNGPKFQAPFSDLLRDAGVQDPFLKKWMDYICFVLQALPADTHPSAPVAYMISDMYEQGAFLDYPKGGMGALINALERGVTKNGGRIRYNAHVEEILATQGKAKGVRLRSGERISAREAVISNASVWDTAGLLPVGMRWPIPKPAECGSFMHLHLGLRAEGLPADMPLHYSVIRDWKEPIDATGNVVIISVPSVVNPSLAPEGRHCLHAYLAATEPYELWQGMKRGSAEYEAFKRERAQPLFEAVEKAVPGACERIVPCLQSADWIEGWATSRSQQGTFGG